MRQSRCVIHKGVVPVKWQYGGLARLLHKVVFAAKYQPLPGLRVAWLSRIEADLDAVRIVIREIWSGASLRDRKV